MHTVLNIETDIKTKSENEINIEITKAKYRKIQSENPNPMHPYAIMRIYPF